VLCLRPTTRLDRFDEPGRNAIFRHMARFLIIAGIALVVIGLLWPWLSKLGLGRLPGDVVIRRENFTFYFPIVTCLLLSAAATLLFWLFRR
jgi:hypothetical protein